MLTMSGAPDIKGLRLGMSPDEVFPLFPGSKDDPDVKGQLARPVGPLGNSGFVIRPAKHDPKHAFTDLTQVSVSVLDGRVANFSIGFNGPEYKHVDEFVTKFIEGTNLPAADQWEAYPGLDTQMKTLTCSGFSIRVFAGGEGGNLNYVLLQDLEADKRLKERRKKAREQASPTPGSKQ